MIYVGIDVAKDKHDCVILDSSANVIFNAFTIENSRDGFSELVVRISKSRSGREKIRIGLEATGHYSYNILGYLLDKNFEVFVINPLHTNLYRKGLSLRKTKTDKVDALVIAKMLMSNNNLKPYSKVLYHNQELKSLTRYRFKKIRDRTKLKQSVSRLITTIFPELDKLSNIHNKWIYALFSKFSSIREISEANLEELTEYISKTSHGHHKEKMARDIIYAAKNSIGMISPAKYLELRHTINLIKEITKEIKEIENEISIIVKKIDSPIMSIPGVGENLGAIILAEIGDFSNFSSPDKILAFAGLSPSTYQSGQIYSSHAKMEKRGSKYLRYAIFNTTTQVCKWEPNFINYLSKKRKEGKHYYVAISHAAKKLIRVIYYLEKTKEVYRLQD